MGVDYIRIIRPMTVGKGYISVHSMEEAVETLSQTKGSIFLTTGSKDLQVFTAIPDYKERIALRVLPSMDSLEKALSLGFCGNVSSVCKVPFQKNSIWPCIAITRQNGSSRRFGYPWWLSRKVRAAKATGAHMIVITRPPESGEAYEAVLSMLQEKYRHEHP